MTRLKPVTVCAISLIAMAGCAAPNPKQAAPAMQPPAATLPVSAEGMYRLGRYYEGQARHERAIAAYREALRRDPLLIGAYTGLGMALAALERHEEAIREFKAAVVLAPHEAHVHNNLGYAYLLSGAHAQAARALDEAIRLDPQHEKSRENLRMAQAQPESPSPQPAAEEMRLVQVTPQVFELKAPAQLRAAAARGFRFEVSNGNGVPGLARRVAARLANAGVRTSSLTNQPRFHQARTELHYRGSYAAEAAEVVKKLEYPVRMVAMNTLRHTDIRLVLGSDLRSETITVALRD